MIDLFTYMSYNGNMIITWIIVIAWLAIMFYIGTQAHKKTAAQHRRDAYYALERSHVVLNNRRRNSFAAQASAEFAAARDKETH